MLQTSLYRRNEKKSSQSVRETFSQVNITHILVALQTNSYRKKMRCLFPFLVFLIDFCESSEFRCGQFDNVMGSVEIYCSNLNETVPVDCVSSFSVANITDKMNVTQLKVNDCGHGNIKQLTEIFANVHSLDVSHSGIKSLNKFDLKREHFKKLNVSHNGLTEVPEKFLSQMPGLIEVDLSHNDLSIMVKFPDKLVKIHLSHNKLTSIHRDDFVNLTELEYVDLSYNSITKLDLFYIFPTNMKLKTLRLEKNAIKEFDYRFTPLLQRGVSMHISWKNITKFMFWNYEAERIRVIRTDGEEGVLETNDGNFELYCNEKSFENILNFQAVSNQIENPTEICHCLTSSLKYLELLGNFAEPLNTSVFERFTNLTHLSLKGTQLKKFDLNVIKNHKKLSVIQLSGNGFTKIDNISALDNFDYPINLDLSDNQLENVPEMLKNLTSKTVDLNLSGNFVGKLNATTFDRFTDMKRLILRNCSVSFDNLKPFEPIEGLNELDISRNILENVNFTMTSMALKQLQILNVGHCKIKNITDVVKSLGSSLWKLDLTGNFLRKLNTDTFDTIKMGLKVLNMSDTHLTDAAIVAALKHLTKLENLDISENKLKTLNFTSVSNHLRKLYLNGNDLNDVETLTKSHFPVLNFLNISKNQFTCEYLVNFIAQLKKEWPHLTIFGDPWEQKREENCHPMDDDIIDY